MKFVISMSLVIFIIFAQKMCAQGLHAIQLDGENVIQEIKSGIESGLKINERNSLNQTVLIRAAKEGYNDIARLLIEFDADVDIRDEYGYTALMGAAESGNLDILRLLLQSRAKINVFDDYDRTALYYAVSSKKSELIYSIINAVPTNERLEYLNNALIFVSSGDSVPLVSELLESGADCNASLRKETSGFVKGTTALMASSHYSKNPNIIRILLKAGANVNARDENNVTPLMCAVSPMSFKSSEKVSLLIEAGAEINSRDKNGRTALMYEASYSPEFTILDFLLKAGADPNIRTRKGESALSLYMKYKYSAYDPKIIYKLLYAGAEVSNVEFKFFDKRSTDPMLYRYVKSKYDEQPFSEKIIRFIKQLGWILITLIVLICAVIGICKIPKELKEGPRGIRMS
jgi:ankyrin repeat protein